MQEYYAWLRWYLSGLCLKTCSRVGKGYPVSDLILRTGDCRFGGIAGGCHPRLLIFDADGIKIKFNITQTYAPARQCCRDFGLY